MKKISLLIMAWLFVAHAMAYDDYGLWCSGHAVLENGKTISGEVSFDLKFQVVRLRKNGMVQAYSAESMAYFELFDSIKKIHRKYVSVESPVHPGYSRKAFFEVISHGKLSYLRRSEYVRRPRATEDMRAPHVYLNTVCRHVYYVHDETSGLRRIFNFKKEVLPMMHSFREEVETYIERCHMSLLKVHEQVRVMNLYNQLHIMDNKLAADTQSESTKLGR